MQLTQVAFFATLMHGGLMEKKDVRIQLVISPSEVEALDEWRAKQRIWSRSEAIRRLIAEGVAKDEPRADDE